jgi:tetratricopeptide (TPR) repeat protein
MKKMKGLDSFRLSAAEGWLGLGDLVSANNELDEITPELRSHPEVLMLRCEIYSKAKKWDYVVAIAEALVKIMPGEQRGWTHRSFALHELNCTQEAFDQLLPAVKLFPKDWLIPYNLSCYCSQLRRFEEAQEWFKKAMAIDEVTVKRTGIDDPDLQPLWDSMSGTLWKME